MQCKRLYWRFLLERPPPAPESRVRDPLGASTSSDGVDPGEIHTFIFPAAVTLAVFLNAMHLDLCDVCFYIVYQQYNVTFLYCLDQLAE